jgi:hypothetical protein
MRPVVLGRKNWIHVGSKQAGPKVADSRLPCLASKCWQPD